MNKTKVWIQAFRLRTLPLSLSGIFLGSLLAKREGFFRWDIFIFACCTTMLFQILTNLANDYGDGVKGTDKNRVGPTRAVNEGLIPKKEMLLGIWVLVLLSMLSSFVLIICSFGWSELPEVIFFFFFGVASIVAAMSYTMGNNPYGYLGLGDAFVFLFFGILSVCGSVYLYTQHFSWEYLLPACSLGLLCVSVLNLNNLRDIRNDKRVGKNTLAVRMGVQKGKIYQTLLVLIPFLLSAIYVFLHFVSISQYSFLLLLIPVFIHLKILWTRNNESLDPELKKNALITLGFALLLGFGQIL